MINMSWKAILKFNARDELNLSQKIEPIFRDQIEELPANKLHSKKSAYSSLGNYGEGKERRAAGETAHLSMEEMQRMGFGWVEKLKVYPTKYGWYDSYSLSNSEMLKGNRKLGELVKDMDKPKLATTVYYTLDKDHPDYHNFGGEKSAYSLVLYSRSEPKFK